MRNQAKTAPYVSVRPDEPLRECHWQHRAPLFLFCVVCCMTGESQCVTAQPHHIFRIRGELSDKQWTEREREKTKKKENTKRTTESDGVKSNEELLLFSLYGVGRSHVVTGDVTFLPGVDGASLPPVTFPVVRDTWSEEWTGFSTTATAPTSLWENTSLQGVAFKLPVDDKAQTKKGLESIGGKKKRKDCSASISLV